MPHANTAPLDEWGVFVSCREHHLALASQVRRHLIRNGFPVFLWKTSPFSYDFKVDQRIEAAKHKFFVLFADPPGIGPNQQEELNAWLHRWGEPGTDNTHRVLVAKISQEMHARLTGGRREAAGDSIALSDQLRRVISADVDASDDDPAQTIVRSFWNHIVSGRERNVYVPPDGNPQAFLYEYEKDIAHDLIQGRVSEDNRLKGAPTTWPKVKRKPDDWAEDDRFVVPVALTEDHSPHRCLHKAGYTFPEARARDAKRFPRPKTDRLKVGIVVSGGIAPGINAVIKGIVDRHRGEWAERENTYDIKVIAFHDGLEAIVGQSRSRETTLFHGPIGEKRGVEAPELEQMKGQGGSWIGTTRVDSLVEDSHAQIDLLWRGVNRLHADRIDILYVIGGDGSMRAAHALQYVADHPPVYEDSVHGGQTPVNFGDWDLNVVTIPKTMDNDILWVWQSFGFLSAVEEARKVLEHLRLEVESNPRLGIVQLFGSDSGFVVSHAAIASSACDVALVPEVPFCTHRLTDEVQGILSRRCDADRQRAFGLIAMAETAIPINAPELIEQPDLDSLSPSEVSAVAKYIRDDRRVRGQTSDDLRRAGLKMVNGCLQRMIAAAAKQNPNSKLGEVRTFTNEPRYLLRAIEPGCVDIITGQRLGRLAVDMAMAGYRDCMISQWLTEFVAVPLDLVVLGRKRIPPSGIFWNSVLESTGQHKDLVCPECVSAYAGHTH